MSKVNTVEILVVPMWGNDRYGRGKGTFSMAIIRLLTYIEGNALLIVRVDDAIMRRRHELKS